MTARCLLIADCCGQTPGQSIPSPFIQLPVPVLWAGSCLPALVLPGLCQAHDTGAVLSAHRGLRGGFWAGNLPGILVRQGRPVDACSFVTNGCGPKPMVPFWGRCTTNISLF